MDKLSYADISQQYLANLVSYKGDIVYVSRVFEDRTVKVFDLLKQVYKSAEFSLEDFSVIKSRLGMVNVFDSVIYMSRIPIRKMAIGLNKSNISVNTVPTEYPEGKDDTRYAVQSLVIAPIVNTLLGIYPSLEEALQQVNKEKPSTIAFDRQFAVNSQSEVFYKTKIVGYVKKSAKSATEIEFDPGYSHLSLLLENNHEKTIGTPCS